MTVRSGESLYIYGMHDRGGENLMIQGGTAKGWVLVTEELRANPNDHGGSNYTDLSGQGFGVVVRLNHAYGADGTIPLPAQYQNFAQRVANFVQSSPGAHIWIIGNEMNLEREQPRKHPGAAQADPITPRLYATCYKLCRDAIHRLPGHADDQVIVGAIGPWNPETPYSADPQGAYPANKLPGGPGNYPYFGFWGDYIQYLRDTLRAIGANNCDGIAIHAYTHGVNPDLVFSNQKMNAPFDKYNYHFRTYRDQMNAIPAEFRGLPVYMTEVDQDEIWENANRGWVKNAYQEIDTWNKAGNQQIRCAILYRWPRLDKWSIVDKPGVQQDLREAVARNYQWDPTVKPTSTIAISAAGYRTRFVHHNTPASLPPAQTLTVSLTIQNVGSFTWVNSGSNPFRLGFQWYNSAGQMVQFPSQLDFRTSLPTDVQPGDSVAVLAQLRTPNTPGDYHLRWDMIHEMITWFTTQGDQGLLVSPVNISTGATLPVPPPTTTIHIQNISASLPQHPTNKYPTRAVSAVTRIIMHHTATPANVSVQRIANYQVSNRGMPGITYHFCVDEAGQVFQTQALNVLSSHAGNHSANSVGVCLIGNFTDSPPPQTQLNAVAALLAQLAGQINIGVDQIIGYNELVVTGSPGATWPTWKGPLLAQVQSMLTVDTPLTPLPAAKPIQHYMLLWHKGPDNWAKWDLLGALEYIDKFSVTIGFSVEEAKSAKYVTILGGAGGVPAETEQILQAAGCQVERLAGATEAETRQLLEQLVLQGKRFKTLS